MREFRIAIPTTLPAATFWALRADFELERKLAAREGRVLEQQAEDVDVVDAHGAVRTRRVVNVALPDGSVPKVLARWVQDDHLRSVCTYEWARFEWHEASAASVRVVFPHFGDGCVSIQYYQHLDPLVPSSVASTEHACVTVHTRCVVEINPPSSFPRWVADTVERIAEVQMKASLERHPRELEKLAAAAAAAAKPTAVAPVEPAPAMAIDGLVPRVRGAGDVPRRCYIECALCGLGRFVCGRVDAIS